MEHPTAECGTATGGSRPTAANGKFPQRSEDKKPNAFRRWVVHDSRCIHKFEATETLTILSDSTYSIGSKVYIAPPTTNVVDTYSRIGFMSKLVSCYMDGLSVKGIMTDSEISGHSLNLCISPDDEVAALLVGYELPEPISVTYKGIVCKE